jgi:3-phenylpropionate/cinnamic acid dioxygenase small subunit
MKMMLSAALSLASATATSADISGAWQIDSRAGITAIVVDCNIYQSGTALTGNCTPRSEGSTPAEFMGRVNGNPNSFTATKVGRDTLLQRVLDESAIRAMLQDYMGLLSARDWDTYIQLFSKDSDLEMAEGTVHGRDAIRTRMTNATERMAKAAAAANLPVRRRADLLTNIHVRVAGDLASASSRFTFITENDAGQFIVSGSGLYIDSLVREEGRWRIKRRKVDWDLLAGQSATPAQAPVPASATPPAPALTPLLVTTFKLKPQCVAEWLTLQETQVIPALKKAGVRNFNTFETILGDAPEYLSLQPIGGFGVFDQPDILVRGLGARAAAKLQAKLDACVLSIHRSIENRRDDFFIDPGTAQVQYTSKYRPMPGRSQDYMSFFRSEMMPVMLKAKENGTFAGLTVTVSAHGGEWGLITLNMYYHDFKSLDEEPPVAKTLGPDATRALLTKGAGLITPLEWIVRRRVAELSF